MDYQSENVSTKDNSYNNQVGLPLVLGPGKHSYEYSEVTASLCINFITTKVPKETSFLRVEGWIKIYVYTVYYVNIYTRNNLRKGSRAIQKGPESKRFVRVPLRTVRKTNHLSLYQAGYL